MIIFNTTYHVEDDVNQQFVDYIRNSYKPAALSSGFLIDGRLAGIVSQYGEAGSSYSLQFRVKNTETLNLWLETAGEKLNRELTSKFGNKVAGFVTLLKEID